MKANHLAVLLGIAAAVAAMPSHAEDHRKATRDTNRGASGMQTVATDTQAGQPGHGWRYFSDARKGRAVVISPDGDYYYSGGKGLALVFKASGAA